VSASCEGCGLCCQGGPDWYVTLGDADRAREPRLFGLAVLAASGPCAFLGADRRCALYAARPDVCRAFEAGGARCLELRRAAGMGPPELGS
jgi:Fe-S-cluster containining protein